MLVPHIARWLRDEEAACPGRSTATAANTAAKPLDNTGPGQTAMKCRPSAQTAMDGTGRLASAYGSSGSRVASSRRATLPGSITIHDHGDMNDTETSLQAENAELRRLLEKHQWAGLTPLKSSGCCPECSGASPPHGRGHRPGCAIAAILAVSAPPTDYL